jgi:hypothetical protein
MNCRLGLKSYGLIDADARFTPTGQRLFELREREDELYAELAKHILLNLHGMTLIQCIQDMRSAGEQVSLTTLRDGLAKRGVHYPSGGKHPSMMHLWLGKAGVFSGSPWQVNQERVNELTGQKTDDFPNLARLSKEQRAFLMALANIGPTQPIPANQITKLASATYGVKFPEKSLPKLVLQTLVEGEYIVATKTTSGRGAKPFLVAPTKKLVAEIIGPLLIQLEKQTDPDLFDLLRKPYDQVLRDLKAQDKHTRGLALEALAFKLMQLLDMKYIATRLRGQATGGAEVDLIFESTRLVFSRWQVQCKNTKHVSLDDVAKEVGLTHLLKSNVIVMVSTGGIGPEARRYANQIMTDSNLCVVMIDRADLENIRGMPAAIVDSFTREARNAMTLKKLSI